MENERISLTLDKSVINDLEIKVKSKLAGLNKNQRVMKHEIFDILSDHSILLQYPIEDDELCAFVCKKEGRIFSYVNTYLPLEKQIFAAAHELYHIWFEEHFLDNGELLKTEVIHSQLDSEAVSFNELKANRFAAMLLVPKEILIQELDYMKVDREKVNLKHIITLMDKFGVPYKTMVRRLFEIGYLNESDCMKLLQIPDRNEKTGVIALQKRFQIGGEMQKRTYTIRLGSLVDEAITAFENKKIAFRKLEKILRLGKLTPSDFNIS